MPRALTARRRRRDRPRRPGRHRACSPSPPRSPRSFFTTAAQWVGAITALALFAIGVFAFLWSYCNAVQRSRTDEISVTPAVPPARAADPAAGPADDARRCSLRRSSIAAGRRRSPGLDGPDGKPGSSLAVGFLVPMFGFGLNGLWAAYHGTFPPPAGAIDSRPASDA